MSNIVISDADRLHFLGVEVTILLDTSRTNGQFIMFEAVMPPGGDTGLHLHEREDESPLVLEGELGVELDGVHQTLTAGQTCFLPRGVPHRLRNTGVGSLRAITVVTPGGFDELLRAVGSPLGGPLGRPSAEQIARLIQVSADHGIQLLGAPD